MQVKDIYDCIRSNENDLKSLPRALEASLISAYYMVNGQLPPLNREF